MSKLVNHLPAPVMRLWERFIQILDARAAREVNAWGASLEYKRRYTNPDTAKLYRRGP
ncbi:MAG TPA: hypothetical protein VED01_02895 [Burkholderiales bacterium]|nr:hypothetical protein [Burkholderiales bacterium]